MRHHWRAWLGTLVLGGFFQGPLPAGAVPKPQKHTRQSGKTLGAGTELPKIELSAPNGGWTLDRMVEVSGTVSDSTIDPITVNLNGERYLLRVKAERGSASEEENSGGDSSNPTERRASASASAGAKFSRKFPAQPGRNVVMVTGANQGGTGTATATFYSKISPVSLSAILTSDTDGVYTDLHIYEPDADAKDPYALPIKRQHVYWARTESPTGGKFYLNEQSGSFDQPGYGPYLYTHTSPPVGIYRIDANYWPAGDKAHTVANLNLTLFGGTANEVKRLARQPLVTPGETVTLAFVRINKGGTGAIYVPGLDSKPKNTSVWPQWVLDHPVTRGSGKTSDPFEGQITEGGSPSASDEGSGGE